MTENSSNSRPQRPRRREQQRPIGQQHYEEVLKAFEEPFSKQRLDSIQAQLLHRCETEDGEALDRLSVRAKVFMGQELKTREIHLSKPLRPTETTVKGALPSAEDVLNEKRAWLEADTRRYWDAGRTRDLANAKRFHSK